MPIKRPRRKRPMQDKRDYCPDKPFDGYVLSPIGLDEDEKKPVTRKYRIEARNSKLNVQSFLYDIPDKKTSSSWNKSIPMIPKDLIAKAIKYRRYGYGKSILALMDLRHEGDMYYKKR